MGKYKHTIRSLIAFLLTYPIAFFMAGIGYGATPERLINEADYAWTLFVVGGGLAIPLLLIVALWYAWLAKKNEEGSIMVLELAAICSIGYNFILFMFWSRLFFGLLKLI